MELFFIYLGVFILSIFSIIQLTIIDKNKFKTFWKLFKHCWEESGLIIQCIILLFFILAIIELFSLF